jgi:hypothetical protein
MTLDLKREGIICTWSFWWRVLLVIGLWTIFYFSDSSQEDIVGVSICMVVVMVSIVRSEPKSVDITCNSVKYRDRVQISKHHHEDVLFTLAGVNSVTIYQNPIERIFGFGHMVIKCTLQLEDASRDLPDRKKHAFYGITDVERLCDEIGAFFPSEIIHIKVFGMTR